MATNGHSGYPLKWFKDQNAARHAYECAICLEILKDPVQVRDCGHQFCALCIDDILKTDPRCPSCRIELSDTKIFEDHAARRLINQLDVNCCNEGCSWLGCLSSLLEDHQNRCNFLIRSSDDVNQLDLGKLEQKLETLMLKVSTLEKKELQHELDIKELKMKYENDLMEVKAKHEQDNKELKFKYENELKDVKLKHENEMKEVMLKQTKLDEDVRVLRQEILMSRTMGAAAQVPQAGQQPESEPTYTWKIANFTRKLARAKSENECGEFESEPFFASSGYRMKLSINVNEGPNGYSGYMGVYIHIMKSDRDGSFPWPFTKRCTFVLVDQQDDVAQRQNIVYTLVPEGEEEFERPRQRENEGLGIGRFVLHSTLRKRQYIRDHAVYIKVFIDP